MISATTGVEQKQKHKQEQYEIGEHDLAIIVKGETDKVLVYWPDNNDPNGFETLRLYSIMIRFEMTLRDVLKEHTSLQDEDLDFFRRQIITESVSTFDSFFLAQGKKGTIH